MAGTRAWLSARGHELAVRDLDFAAFAVVVLVDELTRAAVRERPECITDDRLVDGLCDIVVGYLTHRTGEGAHSRGRELRSTPI
jgi:hypothetical protein